ncbi:hypothetical protein CY96_29710 (plasmid) [Bacillus bombysepticus str. Wang]|uniref:Uncharacterized protein n=1 Tax=Bacillus bombysepticus str. Wang TaxID=1330043 RepID=A0A9W3L6Q4_9BACI|nr:hypothetical protein CY96_29710 [Bacillus bombysepticus str. Wang]
MKKYLFSFVPFVLGLLGILCLLAYNGPGNTTIYILLDISTILIIIGLIVGLALNILNLFRNPTKVDQLIFCVLLTFILLLIILLFLLHFFPTIPK